MRETSEGKWRVVAIKWQVMKVENYLNRQNKGKAERSVQTALFLHWEAAMEDPSLLGSQVRAMPDLLVP